VRHPRIVVCLAVLLIKLIFFFLDPIPKFFFGDSASYLYSALTDWIPEDRSFIYGYLIGPIIDFSRSLVPLLLLQLAAGAGAVFLLAFTLERYFDVRRSLAWGSALLCSVEPIQLLYERYIMTETLSLFVLASYVLAAFEYVRRPRVLVLLVAQMLGVLVVSLRLSFLPVVLLNTLFLPLLGAFRLGSEAAPEGQESLGGPAAKGRGYRSRLLAVPHLVMSVLMTVSLHGGLKQLYSNLTGNPPAYHASEGFFLLATWAPVVIPEDFPIAKVRSNLFDGPTVDLKNRYLRNDQLFDHDGLCWRIRFAIEEYENEGEDLTWLANDLARATAMRALGRDPVGVVRLSLQSFGDYFNVALLRAVIENDLGTDRNQVAQYREFVNDTADFLPLSLNPSDQPNTPLKSYYRVMLPWYWLLVASPLICAVALFPTRGFQRLLTIELFVLTLACVSVAGFLSVLPIVRYLHPVAWLVFYPLALVVDRCATCLGRRTGNREA
jgi:hypothetical protein